MRTDQLIEAMTADAGARQSDPRHGLWIAWASGGIATALLLLATIGVRIDLVPALATWRFDLKLFLVWGAVAAALADCRRCLRPEARKMFGWPTVVLIGLVVLSVAVELFVTPRAQWGTRLIGSTNLFCLVAVPLLAIVPAITVFWAVKRGAPASPAMAGATAGRLAATTAAAVYALHCFDDSPLFVATWYSLAILSVSITGAILGRSILRW